MRSRATVTAALALAAATILAVAACGSSVTGSPEVNTSAAQTISSSSETSTETSTADTTSNSESTEEQSTTQGSKTSLPTDLSELNSLLSALPTGLSVPSELSELSIPSELSDLTNLSIPGYNSACLSVASAYASISLALLPALLGGTGAFNAGDLEKTLSSLTGTVPPELAPDLQALADVAKQASGKSLTEAAALFESDQFTNAQKHIDDWLSKNCNG